MQKLMYLIIPFGIIAITYILVVFIVWDLNPSNWGQLTRTASCIFGGFIAVFATGIYSIEQKFK
jgi:hypothetical protein